jgi:hypothetical protein
MYYFAGVVRDLEEAEFLVLGYSSQIATYEEAKAHSLAHFHSLEMEPILSTCNFDDFEFAWPINPIQVIFIRTVER